MVNFRLTLNRSEPYFKVNRGWVGALLPEKDGGGGFRDFGWFFYCRLWKMFVTVQEIGSFFSWTKTNEPIGRTGNFRDSRTLE